MYRIKKEFKGYPFAHRQWKHDGHCALIHGHNWDFIIELESEKVDDNGFIFDFGRFKPFKAQLEDLFDHTLVINFNDPQRERFLEWARLGLVKLITIQSCSCEGIARHIYAMAKTFIDEQNLDFEVNVKSVTVFEDYKNQATYSENWS